MTCFTSDAAFITPASPTERLSAQSRTTATALRIPESYSERCIQPAVSDGVESQPGTDGPPDLPISRPVVLYRRSGGRRPLAASQSDRQVASIRRVNHASARRAPMGGLTGATGTGSCAQGPPAQAPTPGERAVNAQRAGAQAIRRAGPRIGRCRPSPRRCHQRKSAV
jgi:hypothetical protein